MSVLIMDVLHLCCLFPWSEFCLCQRDCMVYDVYCPFGDSSYYMPNKWQSAMGSKSHSSSSLAPACIQYIGITVAVTVTVT
jgi:hypothetical protein